MGTEAFRNYNGNLFDCMAEIVLLSSISMVLFFYLTLFIQNPKASCFFS